MNSPTYKNFIKHSTSALGLPSHHRGGLQENVASSVTEIDTQCVRYEA